MPKRLVFLAVVLGVIALENISAAAWMMMPRPLIEASTGPASNMPWIAGAVRFVIGLGYGIAATSLAVPRWASLRRAQWSFGVATTITAVVLLSALVFIAASGSIASTGSIHWGIGTMLAIVALLAGVFVVVVRAPICREWSERSCDLGRANRPR